MTIRMLLDIFTPLPGPHAGGFPAELADRPIEIPLRSPALLEEMAQSIRPRFHRRSTHSVAFPLVHPAAILPLRRFCPRHLDFAALVIGAMAPDFAYVLDPLNKFSVTALHVFGASAGQWTSIRGHWDWDDFSHTFAGSVGFCLPAGLLMLNCFLLLRGALVATLPSPHRQRLLPLCIAPRSSLPVQAGSILLGVWTHLVWDWLTNGDRWLALHWPLIRRPVFNWSGRVIEVHHVVWVVTTLGGLVWLIRADREFVRQHPVATRAAGAGEFARYALWSVVIAVALLAAVPVSFAVINLNPSIRGPAGFFHIFVGYYFALLCGGAGLVALDSAVSRRWAG